MNQDSTAPHFTPLSADEAAWARDQARRVVGQVERVIVGKREVIESVLIALLARGHVLVEDIPGVGKTMLVKALARSISGDFKRIQFTPDLLPGDVTGITVYNQHTGEFHFNPGPIFANLVLADEINRATPKTQSALLESMEEAQVTVEGVTHLLPQPFFVLATQNPIEYRGTYPLPEAQMDRFLLRVRMGYPAPAQEAEILARHDAAGAAAEAGTQSHPEAETSQSSALLARVEPVLDAEALRGLQRARMRVHVSSAVRDYIVAIAGATRGHPQVALGASPRGSLALQRAAQAAALLAGREFVTPDDVKRLATAVLPHRLILHDGGAPGEGPAAADRLLAALLEEVPVP